MKKIWVGDVIRDVFSDKNKRTFSATKMAEKLGISITTLYNIIEDPMMEPSYAVKIGKLLNIDIHNQVKELEDYEGMAFTDTEEVYQTKSDSLREEVNLLKSKLIAVYEENIKLRKELDELKNEKPLRTDL